MRQPIMPWFTINFSGDWTSESAAQCNRLIHVTLVTTNFMNAKRKYCHIVSSFRLTYKLLRICDETNKGVDNDIVKSSWGNLPSWTFSMPLVLG